MMRHDDDSSSLAYLSVRELRALLRGGELSAVELLERLICRIEDLDGPINAVVVRDFERARTAARLADDRRRSGDDRPLLGIPMTVKESFNVAGLPTTWGFPAARDFVADDDAAAVQRLKSAGAIIIGKTNIPVAISDWQSFNPIYGTTNNPWDLSLSPGGSSGGSAAALAAGFVPLELGSDLRGSLRVPAHYCGVYGHKPTYGIIPLRGHVPPGTEALPTYRDLAVAGPLARCAEDLGLALDVLAGPDDPEREGFNLNLPPARHKRLRDFRVLVLKAHPLITASTATVGALTRFVDQLVHAGVSVSDDSTLLPDLERTAVTYTKLFMSLIAAYWPAEVYDRIKTTVAAVPAHIDGARIGRGRAAVLSHRDWILVPVLFLFLGIGKATMIALVVLAGMFPVLISTYQGVRGLDPVLLETARTFQISRSRTIVSIILPASLPMILAGMRVALGLGLVLVILAEMLAAQEGIGFRILDLERSFQIRDMFAWIVVLVLLGAAMMKVFDVAERNLVPWRGRS